MGTDDGVSLKWSSTESGTRSFELNIVCGSSSLVGTATAGNAPVVQWTNPSVCDGPIGGSGGGSPGDAGGNDGLEWGALTLIAMSVSGALYLGGGTYRNKQAGAEGWDAMPNASFWNQLPAYVADGVHFSRTKLSAAHSSLEFMAPSEPSPPDGGENALGTRAARKARRGYETLDEEAGGTSEKSSLVSDASSEPATLLPRRDPGKHNGTTKAKAKRKPKAKPKLKPPVSGRKPAASALE